jgi:hypothetical protein
MAIAFAAFAAAVAVVIEQQSTLACIFALALIAIALAHGLK